jgi:hypothetical protein
MSSKHEAGGVTEDVDARDLCGVTEEADKLNRRRRHTVSSCLDLHEPAEASDGIRMSSLTSTRPTSTDALPPD